LDWITESRMAQLCKTPRSTWQSWIKDGFFSVPAAGAFVLEDCLEIALVAAVREQFSLAETRSLWETMRSNGEAVRMISEAASLGEEGHFDLIIDPADGDIGLATDDRSLAHAVRRGDRQRVINIVPLAGEIRELRAGFARLASKQPVSAARAGRPRKTSGTVVELRAQR
jgi:hypothetical protein